MAGLLVFLFRSFPLPSISTKYALVFSGVVKGILTVTGQIFLRLFSQF